MQNRSTDDNSPMLFDAEILQKSEMNLKKLISLLRDFLVNLSALPERGKDLGILAELSFLKSKGLHESTNLLIWSWRTSRAYSLTTGGIPSEQFWTNFGDLTIQSIYYSLTLSTSSFRKTENVQSLSALFEENADPKYHLSEVAKARLIKQILK